jgi:hypothetical protein
MLPRAAQAVFDRMAAHSSCANTTTGAAGSVKYFLEVQFLEVYQEDVLDLLSSAQQQQQQQAGTSGSSSSSSNLRRDVIIREGVLALAGSNAIAWQMCSRPAHNIRPCPCRCLC